MIVAIGLLFISVPLFASQLPKCINDEREIEVIKNKIKINSKNENKYDGYRKALTSDTGEKLMARLVYAETKAANCEKLNSQIIPVITKVIANRVKIKKGDVKAVVFQCNQFASSLNIYSESNYKDFLCPKNAVLWNQALKESSLALTDKSKPSDTVNYFLYKHSPRWTKEPWKLEEDTVLTKENMRDCIRAFKNPTFH